MSRRFVYTAKVAPIGHRIDRDVIVDETTFAAYIERPWHVKVRLDHDPLKSIGQLSDLRVRNGWYQAEFSLDPAHRDELQVGQQVSIGCTQMKRPAGLILFHEISVVPRGAIPGAEIISRRELKPRREPTRSASSDEVEARIRRLGIQIRAGALAPLREPVVADTWEDREARRWQSEAPAGVIRRPGIGQVIGVR